MDEPDGVAMSAARQAAADVLLDVLDWKLPEARWPRIAEMVELIADALARNDLAALDAATIELELSAPVRIVRVGSTKREPPSPDVHERVSRTLRSMNIISDNPRAAAGKDKEGSRGQASGKP